MTGKRDKPTLFEVIRKGRGQASAKPSLSTPQWFSKKSGSGSKKTVSEGADKPGGQVEGSSASDEPSPRRPPVGRLTISVSYLTVAVVILALLFLLVAVYRLGGLGGAGPEESAEIGQSTSGEVLSGD